MRTGTGEAKLGQCDASLGQIDDGEVVGRDVKAGLERKTNDTETSLTARQMDSDFAGNYYGGAFLPSRK